MKEGKKEKKERKEGREGGREEGRKGKQAQEPVLWFSLEGTEGQRAPDWLVQITPVALGREAALVVRCCPGVFIYLLSLGTD